MYRKAGKNGFGGEKLLATISWTISLVVGTVQEWKYYEIMKYYRFTESLPVTDYSNYHFSLFGRGYLHLQLRQSDRRVV